MPAIPTGSRPVALTPVPAHEFGPRSHPGSSQANRDPLVYATTPAEASSHRHAVAGLGSTSPTPTPTPNPHNVCGTAACPPHRDFVPWRFSDAGLSCARTVCVAGVRKPAQLQTFRAARRSDPRKPHRRSASMSAASFAPLASTEVKAAGSRIASAMVLAIRSGSLSP